LTPKYCRFLGLQTPQKINCHHSDHQKALPWTKPRHLSHRALKLDAWFGLWTCGRNKNIYIYKPIYFIYFTSRTWSTKRKYNNYTIINTHKLQMRYAWDRHERTQFIDRRHKSWTRANNRLGLLNLTKSSAPAEGVSIFFPHAHRCYISSVRGGAVSQLIAMKFGTLVELTYVINFANFGVDRSQVGVWWAVEY